jgi:hypothetical protein
MHVPYGATAPGTTEGQLTAESSATAGRPHFHVLDHTLFQHRVIVGLCTRVIDISEQLPLQ